MNDPDWAPLSCTFAGVWELQPSWLEDNLDAVQVLDVREPDEFTGPLGRIRGAKLIPLGRIVGTHGRAREGSPGGCRLPRRWTLGAGDRDSAAGRVRQSGESVRRHAALAREGCPVEGGRS